jgi:hypothetical protein
VLESALRAEPTELRSREIRRWLSDEKASKNVRLSA